MTGIDSCVSSATIDAGRPSVTVAHPCHATLSGITSGTGRAVGENAGACTTSGVMTGTLTFADSAGSYPPVTVSIFNSGGVATFFGTSVSAPGAGFATTSGTFTMACGGPVAGSFAGTYTLL